MNNDGVGEEKQNDSNLQAKVMRLIRLEEKYGHNGFKYGLDVEEEYEEKYRYILHLLSCIENTNSDEENIEKQELKSFIMAELITAETIATILCEELEEYVNCPIFVEGIFREKSITEYSIYCGIYYKKMCFSLASSLEKKSKECDSYRNWLYLSDKVNERFIATYGKQNSTKWFDGRGVAYTVITGGYDELKDPSVITPGVDYICFTDQAGKYTSKIWKIVEIENKENLSPVLMQRLIKMKPYLFLKEYDYSIYVDGKIRIIGDLRQYINTYAKESSMLCFAHPSRNTLEEEAKAIVYYGRYANPELLKKQVEHYYANGYTDQMQLIESSVLVRAHKDPILKNVMENWWKEINEWTTRDQLSFGYSCWKNEYVVDISNLVIGNNPFFITEAHNC